MRRFSFFKHTTTDPSKANTVSLFVNDAGVLSQIDDEGTITTVGGDSQTFEHVVFPIAYNTPGIIIPASGPAGVKVCDLAPGDVLLTQLSQKVSVTTAWNGTTPQLNVCVTQDRGNLPGTPPTAEGHADATAVDSGVTPSGPYKINSFGAQWSTFFDPSDPDIVVASTALYVYIDDGAGGDPGSTQGQGAIHVFIARAS